MPERVSQGPGPLTRRKERASETRDRSNTSYSEVGITGTRQPPGVGGCGWAASDTHWQAGRSTLAPILQSFFTDPSTANAKPAPAPSPYRDGIRLLRRRRPHLEGSSNGSADRTRLIGAFCHRETSRNNSVRTRNARLAAIHSLFRHAALPPRRRRVINASWPSRPTLRPHPGHHLTGRRSRSCWPHRTGAPDRAPTTPDDAGLPDPATRQRTPHLTAGDVHLGTAHASCEGRVGQRITPLTTATVTPCAPGGTPGCNGLPPGLRFDPPRRPLSRDGLQRRLTTYTATAARSLPEPARRITRAAHSPRCDRWPPALTPACRAGSATKRCHYPDLHPADRPSGEAGPYRTPTRATRLPPTLRYDQATRQPRFRPGAARPVNTTGGRPRRHNHGSDRGPSDPDNARPVAVQLKTAKLGRRAQQRASVPFGPAWRSVAPRGWSWSGTGASRAGRRFHRRNRRPLPWPSDDAGHRGDPQQQPMDRAARAPQ